MNPLPFALNSLGLTLIVLARYLATSGGAYLICWIWKRDAWAHRRIEPEFPPRELLSRERRWSAVTCAIFGVTGALLARAYELGHTRIYLHVAERGWAYLAFSLVAYAILHDTYFYWTHRLMHLPRVYRRMHKIHHDSRNPSPWAAFSFHPLESLSAAVIVPALTFVIPIQIGALLAFLLFMTVLAVFNHLGYELYPRGFNRHPFFRHWISATHHQMHHRSIRCNYGLYFTTWDRLLGTHHPEYEDLYDRVKARVAGEACHSSVR